MAATGYSSWADLNSELLVSIAAADGLSLRDYDRLRGVCTSWRSALPPPYPCLLSLTSGRSASVFSLPTRSSFHLYTSTLEDSSRHGRRFKSLSKPPRIVGSSNGCFAVQYPWSNRIFLVNPRAGEEVEIASVVSPTMGKLVFAPNTPPPARPAGWTLVALYDRKRVAYMDTRSGETWKWRTISIVARNTAEYVADLAMDAGGSKVYCLDSRGGVHVLRITHVGREQELAVAVEPLQTLMLTPVPAAFPAAFAPPHGISSAEHSTKHLFFCHGSLYQVCQRNDGYSSGACEDKISLLRYDTLRWPCWDVVNDLGGCSVFVSTGSSPAVVQPAAAGGSAVSGVRADCVYWISSLHVAMVCDISTGTSEPLVGPDGLCIGCCWYFSDDNMMGIVSGASNSMAAR